MANMIGDRAVCERCGYDLGTCPKCQGPNDTGERYCRHCDWCEACGRSGSRSLPKTVGPLTDMDAAIDWAEMLRGDEKAVRDGRFRQ
jgi:hypothetical protein